MTRGQETLGSGDVCTNGVRVDGIYTLACGHEEAVALATTKADIGADFREVDLANLRKKLT